MRLWNLKEGDPLHLTLAADASLSSPNYLDDQIWQLALCKGEPSALALETTFGCRARIMRLFPRFHHNDKTYTDPTFFTQPPRIIRFAPNYFEVQFSPFPELDVICEYWVPESKAVSGRVTLSNLSKRITKFRFEWAALLRPLNEGSAMAPKSMGVNTVLEGKTADLIPVLSLTGGPQLGDGAFPSLCLDIDLTSGAKRQVTWVLASTTDAAESFETTRKIAARQWDAEIARIELLDNSRMVDIRTGNPDWDAALAFSQRAVYGLFFPAGGGLPSPSFVLERNPDLGYSLRGDGKDYNHLWNGQTALEAWHIGRWLCFTQPQLATGLVSNYLAVQQESGFIDWKPGLAGQTTRRMLQPFLAGLAWQSAASHPDSNWLFRIFPALMQYYDFWFTPENDRDLDGLPEWSHPYQNGIEELPIFDTAHPDSDGIRPEAVETPALGSLLAVETQALINIAARLGDAQAVTLLEERLNRLKQKVAECWDAEHAIYRYRDNITHLTPQKQILLQVSDSGTWPIRQRLSQPARLKIQILASGQFTRRTHLMIHGETTEGSLREEVQPLQIQWQAGIGRYTTRQPFIRLEEVIIRNLIPGDLCTISIADFTSEDITLSLPIWAGLSDPEQTDDLIEKTIKPSYMHLKGLSLCPRNSNSQNPLHSTLSPIWSGIIAEGLLTSGRHQEAAAIFNNLISAISENLKVNKAWHSHINAKDGSAAGERNTLAGIVPIGSYFKLLGLEYLSADRVIINGFSPFLHPVTVQYRGTLVEFIPEKTRVIFAGRQPIEVETPGPHEIRLR